VMRMHKQGGFVSNKHSAHMFNRQTNGIHEQAHHASSPPFYGLIEIAVRRSVCCGHDLDKTEGTHADMKHNAQRTRCPVWPRVDSSS
jgi:hypothetical protein